jgi:hypothetical protein
MLSDNHELIRSWFLFVKKNGHDSKVSCSSGDAETHSGGCFLALFSLLATITPPAMCPLRTSNEINNQLNSPSSSES